MILALTARCLCPPRCKSTYSSNVPIVLTQTAWLWLSDKEMVRQNLQLSTRSCPNSVFCWYSQWNNQSSASWLVALSLWDAACLQLRLYCCRLANNSLGIPWSRQIKECESSAECACCCATSPQDCCRCHWAMDNAFGCSLSLAYSSGLEFWADASWLHKDKQRQLSPCIDAQEGNQLDRDVFSL